MREPLSIIEERIDRLRQTSEKAAIEFVFAELTSGIISCRIAKARRDSSRDYTYALRRAERTLRAADKYVWRFKMKHPEFDQMTALAERLRMELDALKPRNEPT